MLNWFKYISAIKLESVLTSNKSVCLVYDNTLQINMAEQNENVPEQSQPLLTMDDITPADYNVVIGNNNPRVDFEKLRISENFCRKRFVWKSQIISDLSEP